MKWEDQQRAAIKAIKGRDTQDIQTCKRCGGEWFEQKKFSSIKKNWAVPPGVAVPRVGDEYVAIKCMVCNQYFEPMRTGFGHDGYAQRFQRFLEHIEKWEEKQAALEETSDVSPEAEVVSEAG